MTNKTRRIFVPLVSVALNSRSLYKPFKMNKLCSCIKDLITIFYKDTIIFYNNHYKYSFYLRNFYFLAKAFLKSSNVPCRGISTPLGAVHS